MKDIIFRISKSHLEDYDFLSDRNDKERSPFRIRKDVFMAAVAYGFLEEKSEPLKSPTHDVFRTSVLSESDKAILKALFLKNKNFEFDKDYTDENIVHQAQKWAEGGISLLKRDTINDDGSNLENLIELVTKY